MNGETILVSTVHVKEFHRQITRAGWKFDHAAPIRGEFDVIWKYDTQSLLLHYGCIMSLSGLEQITGIHQKQLWSYMHGRTKPRAPQKQRIEFALHNFGKELSSLALI